jgi:molybdate transport system permease protein
MDWAAIRLSLLLATCTTAVLLTLGTPLAAWIAFSRRRWKILVEAVVALPLVLPPTVLGFYLLIALGPRSPVGAAYGHLFDSTLPFSFPGLLIASLLYSLPFMVQPLAAAFAAVDRRLIEASYCQGVSRSGTLLRLVIPLSVRGVIAASVLAFAHTVGEFGVVLMVGGNIPGRTRTASISVYDSVQSMDYEAAWRTSAFLVVMAFVALSATYALRRRGWSP